MFQNRDPGLFTQARNLKAHRRHENCENPVPPGVQPLSLILQFEQTRASHLLQNRSGCCPLQTLQPFADLHELHSNAWYLQIGSLHLPHWRVDGIEHAPLKILE